MASFKIVRDCCMHLHTDKTVALYVSYFCLYFPTQLVCVSGRVQLIAFWSTKMVLNNSFLEVTKPNSVIGRKS